MSVKVNDVKEILRNNIGDALCGIFDCRNSSCSCESCEYFMSFPAPTEDFDGLCGASTGHHEVDCDEWCTRFSPRKEKVK